MDRVLDGKRGRVRLVDEIDGGDAAVAVVFGLEGKSYEIDLSEKRAAELRDISSLSTGVRLATAPRRLLTAGVARA